MALASLMVFRIAFSCMAETSNSSIQKLLTSEGLDCHGWGRPVKGQQVQGSYFFLTTPLDRQGSSPVVQVFAIWSYLRQFSASFASTCGEELAMMIHMALRQRLLAGKWRGGSCFLNICTYAGMQTSKIGAASVISLHLCTEGPWLNGIMLFRIICCRYGSLFSRESEVLIRGFILHPITGTHKHFFSGCSGPCI